MDKKVVGFKMVCDHDVLRFETEVQLLLNIGWQLHGTGYIHLFNLGCDEYGSYAQAMVMYEYVDPAYGWPK